MSEQDKIAPTEQNAEVETIGKALDTLPKSEEATKQEETVPLSALLEIKKENKALSRELREMKKSIEQGESKKATSKSIESLAEKFPDVDPNFLQEFAAAVREESKKETEEEISEKLKPIQEKDKAEKIEKAFNTHFKKTMESLKEYEGIVNKDVIKALSLLPENANKTFTQIIEESYGHIVSGKRSMDSASSRVSKNDTVEVDVARARKDPEYFQEIMASPELKKKYNAGMVSRIASQI